jgi:hypothetical protein
MDAHHRSTASPASGSKRSRSPNTVEEAWRLKCKRSAAGSCRAACRYAGALYVPNSLREFAAGGRWYRQDPPLKPMSGRAFEKWLAEWQRDRASKAAWAATIGSTSDGGSGGGEEEEEAAEEEAAFRRAVAESEADAAEKARAEAEEEAAAIAAVAEFQAKEAAARAEEEAAARGPFVPFIILE